MHYDSGSQIVLKSDLKSHGKVPFGLIWLTLGPNFPTLLYFIVIFHQIEEIEKGLVEVLKKIAKSEITKILETFEESDPEISDEEELSTSNESAYDSDDEGEPTVGPAKSYSTTKTNTELTMEKLSEILDDPSLKGPKVNNTPL